jgi:hypothetical protein
MLSRQSFVTALAECDNLIAQYPLLDTLLAIRDQVEYLAALHRGEAVERARIKDLIIGVQVAREIEHLLAPHVIDVFVDITEYAHRLQHAQES